MALKIGNKVENEGATPDGILTAKEFNTLVQQVNGNESDIAGAIAAIQTLQAYKLGACHISIAPDGTLVFKGFANIQDKINYLNNPTENAALILTEELVFLPAFSTPAITDRGLWAEGEEYYAGDVVGKDGRLEISDTWRYGQRWRCLVTGTATEGNGPGYGQPGWQFVGGDDALTVRFVNPPLLWDYENPYGVLQLQVIFRGEDITDRLPSTATQWERYSETADGVERVALDAAWTAANRWSGMAREIRAEDCQNKASEGVGVLKFTATVTVSDMEAVAEFTI